MGERPVLRARQPIDNDEHASVIVVEFNPAGVDATEVVSTYTHLERHGQDMATSHRPRDGDTLAHWPGSPGQVWPIPFRPSEVCIYEGLRAALGCAAKRIFVEGNVVTDNASVEATRMVRQVLDEVYAAWSANDADAFVEPYAETATAILPGSYLAGRQAIRATMAALFAGELKGSTAVHEVQGIRFVGTDVAIVTSKGAVLLAGQTGPDAGSRALETWVLSGQGGTWHVEAFHNCLEQPPERERGHRDSRARPARGEVVMAERRR